MPLLVHSVGVWLAGCAFGAMPMLDHWSTLAVALAGAGVGAWSALLCAWNAVDEDDPRRYERERSRVGVMGRGGWTLALPLVGAAAVLTSRAEQQWTANCRRRVAATVANGQAVPVSLEAAVRAPGHAMGVAAVAACRVPVVVTLREGAAAAGEWVRVQGRALPTARMVRIEGGATPIFPRQWDWPRRFRGRAGEQIDALFGQHAPVVRALLIADQAAIPPPVRDQFAQAGLVHLLSISGLHVAIIAGALQTVASALRLSRLMAAVASLFVCTAYVMLLGAPAPAVRSTVMLAVTALAEHRQQPVHPWTALALGALLPTLLQASVVLDLGWQLSVGGMAALVAARAMLRRWRTPDPSVRRRGASWRLTRWLQRQHGGRRWLVREVFTGVVATAVTAPMVAWSFGRLSLVAPFSNLLAGPVVTLLQPGLFLALLLAPWPTGAGVVAAAMQPLLAGLSLIAKASAAVPGASLAVAPTAATAIGAGVAAAAVVRATAARRPTPWLLVAACAGTVLIWAPTFAAPSGELELHLLDVGQGDALALRTPRGHWVLIDAGRRWEGGDAGRRTVVPYVNARGGAVAAFLLTHPHDDHAGGAASVLEALSPTQLWEPAFVSASDSYAKLLKAGRAQQVSWHRVHPGDQWQLDGVTLQVLAPDSLWTVRQTNANETSVVLRVAFGDVVFLLTGDAQTAEESWILAHTDPGLLRADLLKVGHHGSRTSSSAPFLDAVQPRLGVISVGAENRYGHPDPTVLTRLAHRGVPVLRTDQDGTLVVTTNGHELWVRAGTDRWRIPPRSEPVSRRE